MWNLNSNESNSWAWELTWFCSPVISLNSLILFTTVASTSALIWNGPFTTGRWTAQRTWKCRIAGSGDGLFKSTVIYAVLSGSVPVSLHFSYGEQYLWIRAQCWGFLFCFVFCCLFLNYHVNTHTHIHKHTHLFTLYLKYILMRLVKNVSPFRTECIKTDSESLKAFWKQGRALYEQNGSCNWLWSCFHANSRY